jgi:uroporphyrinogen-III synthase
VAAVGPATAAELRTHGVEPDLVPDEYVAEGLLAALGDMTGKRMLLPRAAKARRTLADELRHRGALVDDIPTYDTVPTDDPRPDLSGVDAITFTSGSTVQYFLDGSAVPPGARVICIGPQTAERARSLGLDVHAVAGDYTEDGLIAALVAALKR